MVEERDVVGPSGEHELEALDDRGRRWYQLRPRPSRGYDLGGIGVLWWTIFWIVVIGLIAWGWGWGWAA